MANWLTWRTDYGKPTIANWQTANWCMAKDHILLTVRYELKITFPSKKRSYTELLIDGRAELYIQNGQRPEKLGLKWKG